MPDPLTLLHTAASHVAGFERLLARMAPGARARHAVRADLLVDACRFGGADERIRVAVAGALHEAAGADGTGVVLCTCSTIGGVAERVGVERGLRVLRVDRPMAERAVRTGPRLQVLAALPETLSPSVTLLEDAAHAAGHVVRIATTVCEGAWPLFEAGRIQDYLQCIASHAARVAGAADVIVLAQASMAPAALLCAQAPAVLSSPSSGLEAGLELAGYYLHGRR